MLQQMTCAEYQDWLQLWREDPWGDDRADWRSGQLAEMFANVNRDTKQHPKPFKLSEFCWSHLVTAAATEAPKAQSVEQQQTIAKTIQAALAGRGVRGNDRTA